MSMARRFRAWAFAEKWFRTDFTSTAFINQTNLAVPISTSQTSFRRERFLLPKTNRIHRQYS